MLKTGSWKHRESARIYYRAARNLPAVRSPPSAAGNVLLSPVGCAPANLPFFHLPKLFISRALFFSHVDQRAPNLCLQTVRIITARKTFSSKIVRSFCLTVRSIVQPEFKSRQTIKILKRTRGFFFSFFPSLCLEGEKKLSANRSPESINGDLFFFRSVISRWVFFSRRCPNKTLQFEIPSRLLFCCE